MPKPSRNLRGELVQLLQLAYSGEKAAALAYSGHARALRDPVQRQRVERIEQDEWIHREKVGRMLQALDARPLLRREWRAAVIGRMLSVSCRLTGWFLPMYFAGKLETSNVCQYDRAAELASAIGHQDFLPVLAEMAAVEADHEKFFLEIIGRVVPENRGCP